MNLESVAHMAHFSRHLRSPEVLVGEEMVVVDSVAHCSKVKFGGRKCVL